MPGVRCPTRSARMKRSRRLILISALLIGGGYLFLAKPALDLAEGAAVYSCVASIHQSLVDFGEKTPHGTGVTFDTVWRELSPPEYDRVMARVKSEGKLDRGRSYWNEEGRFVDPWGQPYHIAGRVVPGGGVEFMVWSSGRDCVSGSTDDVGSPPGAKAPVMR